jgi:hypothetical protein
MSREEGRRERPLKRFFFSRARESFRWGGGVASGRYRRRAQAGENRRLSPEHADT